MKLIASISVHTPKGVVAPGEPFEIKDKLEAAYLVSIGAARHAEASAGAEAAPPADDPGSEGAA